MPHGVRPPYGYTAEWRIDPPAAANLRLLFQMACAGKSYQAMMEKLPGWKQEKIYYYIQQPTYTGTLRYTRAGEICVKEEHHPAIVTRDVFEAVQVLQQMNLLTAKRALFTETELVVLDYAWRMGVAAWGKEVMQARLEGNGNGGSGIEGD